MSREAAWDATDVLVFLLPLCLISGAPPAQAVVARVSARTKSYGETGKMAFFSRLLGIGSFGKDMAVDLGTANTLVYAKGEGIVLNEPSVVAVNTVTNAIIAVCEETRRMVGRTPAHIVAIRPLKDGFSSGFDVTEKMLRYFMQKVHQRRSLARPRVVVGVPGAEWPQEREISKKGESSSSGAVLCCAASSIGCEMKPDFPWVVPVDRPIDSFTHRERLGAAPARRTTEAYSLSTARKRNAAGADASMFECQDIYGTVHWGHASGNLRKE